jgi:YD repeat-containing protein
MAGGIGAPPPGLVTAASYGDLVLGLASTTPPQPFVGELGAATDTAAGSVVGDMVRSADAPVRAVPKVKVLGRTIGTLAELVRAIPASPTPGIARMIQGSGVVRIAGQAVTMMGTPAFVTPLSAMADIGGGQSILRLRGPAPQVDPPESDEGPSVTDARQSVPGRVGFGPASALHQIVSQCSPARRLDLAPAAYQVLVGDPVDVVTGSVVTRATDFHQLWPAVQLRRRYDSRRSGRCSSLGHGWTHELDQSLWIEPGRVVLRDGDGREHEFSTMALPGRVCRPGDELHDPARRLRLRCVAASHYEVSDERTLRQFATRDPAEAERGLVRLTRLVDRQGPMLECVYSAGSAGAGAATWSSTPGAANVSSGVGSGSGSVGALLVEVRVDGNPVMRLEYERTGLLRRLCSVNPDGELVEATYEYSSDRDLVEVSDAEGRLLRYAYRGHLLVEEQSRDGARFHYGYDGVGSRARCVRAWGEGGFLDRSLEHDPSGNRTTVRDGLGHETIYRYDPAGLVSEIIAPDGQHVTYRYDDHLRLVETAWSDGTRATAAYDVMGNLVSRSDRDGATWTMEYDARGHLVHGVDPLGGHWRFQHDERGRLRQLQDPAGHITLVQLERGIDGHDRVTEMPTLDGERVRFAYDHRGRLVNAWSGNKTQLQWRWDRANRLLRHDGQATRTIWRRTAGGEVAVIEHDGRAIRIDRDAFGTIRAIDDGQRTLGYMHDVEGRLMKVTEDGTELLSLEHGPDGHVRAFTAKGMPHGAVRRHGRTARITAIELGDDAIALEHDAAGRITKIDRDGRPSTYAYRPDGHLVTATNEHVTCTFERDPLGAVTEQRFGEVVMSETSPDHRGRRGGLRLAKRARLSFLRGRDGTVERIAATAEVNVGLEPQELSPTPSPDAPAIPVPTFETASTDALGRALSSRGSDHVVWDEDRCVAVGELLVIHHPDRGQPLYAIDGEGRVQPLAEPKPAPAEREAAPLDRMLATAFPAVVPPLAASPTPRTLLAGLLGHRAWIPQIRPIPGTGPWDPDLWGPRVDAPEPEIGRLDAETLLRALGSPFPRRGLEVRSFDRRLPPPEPVP